MKKIIITIVFYLFIYTSLIAVIIDNITSITHNRLVADYAQYCGSIKQYENRLFIQTPSQIEELEILNDGSLLQLSMVETSFSNFSELFIDEAALYGFYHKNGCIQMMIFDISTIPMTHTATIPLPFYPSDRMMYAQAYNEYILISDKSTCIYKFNKYTLSWDGVIQGVYGNNPVDGSLLYSSHRYSSNGVNTTDYIIRITDLDTISDEYPYGEIIDEIYLGLNIPMPHGHLVFLKVENGVLYAGGWGFLAVYNIVDIQNISRITFIEIDRDRYVNDAILYNEKIYLYRDQRLLIFDIEDPETPLLIYTSNHINMAYVLSPMQIYDDKLYLMSEYFIAIYSLTNSFPIIATYGTSDFDVRLYPNGLVCENKRTTSEIAIYSILDDNFPTINIDLGLSPGQHMLRDFKIDQDLLYASVTISGSNYLEIYNIENSTAQLLLRYSINFLCYRVSLIDEYILLREINTTLPFINHLYKFINNELEYFGFFVGNTTFDTGYEHEDYFLSFTHNAVEFRSKENPLTILHSIQGNLPHRYYLHHISSNEFVYGSNGFFDIYQFNYSENGNPIGFNLCFSQQTPLSIASFYNSIMTLFSPSDSIPISFFYIDQGLPRLIGECVIDKMVRAMYLYPEYNKMLLHAGSGIHVYDIEYTEIVSETDNPMPITKTELLGNYPNPFNPSTTIKYSLSVASILRIDIFNIKGQKVKSLLNEYRPAGEHKVVWNGKDDNGNDLGSGIYFYRMEAERYVETRKMVLMK